MFVLRLGAALVAALSTAVHAQPAPVVSAACELHVWPGDSLSSVYSGWFHGGIVNGGVTGRDGYRTVPTEPLSTLDQTTLLKEVPLGDLLKLDGYQIVVHDTALDSRTIRGTPGRLAASQSPCYAELITDDIVFQEDIVTGRRLKTLFRFRNFGGEQIPVRGFGTWAQTDLRLFPAKTADTEPAAAQEVRAAFQQNVSQFAGYLNAPAKKKR